MGSKPIQAILGIYDTFPEARKNMDDYFNRSLVDNERDMYQFDEYIIQSREVGRQAYLPRKQWYIEYVADYGVGELTERE